MAAFEYLLLFATVVLGLAVSDLAISVHRLLNAAGRVRWDWLAPLAACLAFERIVAQWWTWYGAERLASGMTYGMFVVLLVSAVLLFLMAAVALPDDVAHDGIDLAAYYARISRRYWLLFALQWLSLNAVSNWLQAANVTPGSFLTPAMLVLPASLLLAWVRLRWVQAVGLVGFVVLYGVVYFGRPLG